ncbi:MAG TPA: hypothetical protein VFY12_03005 [Arenimonas sp.]|nr:hypothetical protein [Arenimonas sp.]
MYQNLKNTLCALTIAAGGMVFSAGLGNLSPSSLDAASNAAIVASMADAQPADGKVAAPARRSGSLKRQLAMPFISFSPLLSRRGG